MGKNGGARPGAGRPKGKVSNATLDARKFREYVVQRVIKEKGPLVDAAIREAKMGNMAALNLLLDRVIGKQPLPLEHDLGGNLAEIILKQIGA